MLSYAPQRLTTTETDATWHAYTAARVMARNEDLAYCLLARHNTTIPRRYKFIYDGWMECSSRLFLNLDSFERPVLLSLHFSTTTQTWCIHMKHNEFSNINYDFLRIPSISILEAKKY